MRCGRLRTFPFPSRQTSSMAGAGATLAVVTLVSALCGTSEAFLDGLFVPAYQVPSYQTAYRRAVYDPSTYSQPATSTGYANSRPVLYQWFPWMNPQQQSGSATYDTTSTSTNPLISFFQSNPWFPWINRQPGSGSGSGSGSQSVSSSQQQPAVWTPVSLLPWGGQGPVVSFLQNSGGVLFPWGNRPVAGTASTTGVGEDSTVTYAATPTLSSSALQAVKPAAAASTSTSTGTEIPVKASTTSSSSLSSTSGSVPTSGASSMMMVVVDPQKLSSTEADTGRMTAMLMQDAAMQQAVAGDANSVRSVQVQHVQPCQ